MKPISLCLVQMGQKGLELVDNYPKVLPTDVLNQIVIKSMPFNAKNGDFVSSNVGDNVFSGYVFALPCIEGRDNLASLVAVYDTMKYDHEAIRKIFTITVSELAKNNLVDSITISKILPNLYKGLEEGSLKVKISSVVTLEFDINQEEPEDKDSKALNIFKKDTWK